MDVVYVNAAQDDTFLSHLNAKKKFANHLTYSAIPDNYDKVLISHISRRDQLRSEPCSLFLPGGGDKVHFMCLQLVLRICSASDKFRLMTIKLLYAFSDKQTVLKVKYFPHF